MVDSPLLEVLKNHMDVAPGAMVGFSQSLDFMMLEVFSNLNDSNSTSGEGTPGSVHPQEQVLQADPPLGAAPQHQGRRSLVPWVSHVPLSQKGTAGSQLRLAPQVMDAEPLRA